MSRLSLDFYGPLEPLAALAPLAEAVAPTDAGPSFNEHLQRAQQAADPREAAARPTAAPANSEPPSSTKEKPAEEQGHAGDASPAEPGAARETQDHPKKEETSEPDGDSDEQPAVTIVPVHEMPILQKIEAKAPEKKEVATVEPASPAKAKKAELPAKPVAKEAIPQPDAEPAATTVEVKEPEPATALLADEPAPSDEPADGKKESRKPVPTVTAQATVQTASAAGGAEIAAVAVASVQTPAVPTERPAGGSAGPTESKVESVARAEPKRPRAAVAAVAEPADQPQAEPAVDEPAAELPEAVKAASDLPSTSTGRAEQTPAPRSETVPVARTESAASQSRRATNETSESAAVDTTNRAQLIQRVAGAFESAAERGGPIRLRLHPPELGSLRVEVTVRNGAMSARLEAESETARNVLIEHLPALRERLAEHQVRVDRFEVNWSGSSPGGLPQQTADQQRRDDRAPASYRLTQSPAGDSAAIGPAAPRRGNSNFDVVV